MALAWAQRRQPGCKAAATARLRPPLLVSPTYGGSDWCGLGGATPCAL